MLKFAITLSQEGQSEVGRKGVAEFLAENQIALSAKGLSTLSCETSEEIFGRVFLQGYDEILTPLRNVDTIGASAPLPNLEIHLPDPVRPYIDYISITPPIRRF